MDIQSLIDAAVTARETAYAPYSGFKVGAALLTKSGRVYTGINIENAAYSPSNCAERTAFFNAVANGEREFEAICVAGWNDNGERGLAYPCGVCRQVMAEFCDADSFTVIITDSASYKALGLRELLPFGFGKDNL